MVVGGGGQGGAEWVHMARPLLGGVAVGGVDCVYPLCPTGRAPSDREEKRRREE